MWWSGSQLRNDTDETEASGRRNAITPWPDSWRNNQSMLDLSNEDDDNGRSDVSQSHGAEESKYGAVADPAFDGDEKMPRLPEQLHPCVHRHWISANRGMFERFGRAISGGLDYTAVGQAALLTCRRALGDGSTKARTSNRNG